MQQISLGTKEPRRMFPQNEWIEGLSNYNKIGGAYVWARGVDYRTEPSQLKLLPQALPEGAGVFSDLGKFGEQVVGRTVNIGAAPNLIANGSFETNSTGWTLGADYTRASDDAYIGAFSIKQVSTTGAATFTTASGSGLPVSAYADYQLTFQSKVAVSSGAAPQLQILGGSLSGPNLLSAPLVLPDTAGSWEEITVSFNALQYTTIFIVITNQGSAITAHYDAFSLNQINSIATYVIGNTGNLYKRYSNATWVSLGQLPNSHGNGLAYYGEDDFLYLMGDHTVGRFGPISSGIPSLVPDYLQSAGGIPTNTNSTLLIAADSQYWVKTSPASALKIAGDLAIEAFLKPTSLPAVGSSMTIAGIWKESTNNRAWKLDLFGVSGVFGTGADGNVTISTNTTDAPIDSACSGTAAANVLNANNGSFAVGQKILIIQMQGANAGTYQTTTIQGYDSTNHLITTQDALSISYNSSGNNKAQVLVMKQYGNVTVNTGIVWSPKAWNGTTGGILAFYANGIVTVTGTILGTNAGFRGGIGVNSFDERGWFGEGTAGPSFQQATQAPNNLSNGNGGGTPSFNNSSIARTGGAGSNGTTGGPGTQIAAAGIVVGTTDLTNMNPGGGGGGGVRAGGAGSGAGAGAIGGGIIFIIGATITGTGAIVSNGAQGVSDGNDHQADGGSSGGGSILLKAQTATLAAMSITATGGPTTPSGNNQGGDGRINLDYLISYSANTAPVLNVIQDNTLVTSPMTQVRLGISNDGTAFEYLTQNLRSLVVGQWERISVSWASALSTASFYENGVSIGQNTGTKTAILSTPSADFAVGANVGASVYQNFLDSEVNDVRVWNAQKSQAQIAANLVVNLNGTATNLVGNWFVTNTGNDLTANVDNLIATGSPTPSFVTDTPYPGATTRGDLDQTGGGTGQTYTLPTALTENQKQSFVPAYDPQKSLQVNIGEKGTGDWTLVVHDGLNELQVQMAVLNANLPSSGQYEFKYPATFRPVRGATYHWHLWSTVNDGSIVTSAASDITTAQFSTYYQFLVNDTEYHPGMQMGNLLGIGNERYLAVVSAAGGDGIGTYNLQGYNPHRLSFPAGWRVRCVALWRGQYAIGCWRGTSIKDFDQGMVFIWDGFSPTYNDFFFVPQGGVNAMWGENGILYLIAGYQGDLLEYTGDLMAEYGYDIVNKAKRLPKLGVGNEMEVAPGAMTYYDSLLRIGAAYRSTGETLERGVYTWGSRYSDDPKSLSYDIPISTGNRGASVSVGLMLPVGGDLLIFRQDGASFGVDNYSPTNPPQTTGTIEGLIFDANSVYHPKELLTVRANHFPLGTGANVDVKYKIDYENTWHNLGIGSQLAGDITTRLPLQATDDVTNIESNEYHAVQIGIDLYATGGVSPILIETGNFTDLLTSEGDETDL